MSSLVDINIPRPEKGIFKTASNALDIAKAYEIDSNDMRNMAAKELIKIKGLQKEIDAKRKSITKPIDEAKKTVMDLFRQPVEFLEMAESFLKTSIMVFDTEQKKISISEQAKLEEVVRNERERIQREAASMENEIEAHSIMQISELLTAPVVAAPRATAGVSSRTVWKAKVADKIALIRFIAAHPEYVDLIDVNMPAVNKIALALRDNCPLDGVRVFEETVIAARAA